MAALLRQEAWQDIERLQAAQDYVMALREPLLMRTRGPC
jgi:hypothetical protein